MTDGSVRRPDGPSGGTAWRVHVQLEPGKCTPAPPRQDAPDVLCLLGLAATF